MTPFHVVLVEPEIPQNAGNIARLCAATGCHLHFVGPLGFRLDDKHVRRAGLDYWPHVTWTRYESWAEFRAGFPGRLWYVDNPAPKRYTQAAFAVGDGMVFGSESKGLPTAFCDVDTRVEIPMANPHVRSLNLATSVGIVVYEALRQIG